MMKRSLRKALDERHRANEAVAHCLQTRYRIGEPIYWTHNGREQPGLVEGHSGDDRLKVFNTRTNRSVWIYAYRITS